MSAVGHVDLSGNGSHVLWRDVSGYIVYRHEYPHAFAVASKHTNLLYGTINTAILLTSSLWMAFAVHAAAEGWRKQLVRYLLLTILFAVGFLGVKALEYREDFIEHLIPGRSFSVPEAPKSDIFFYLYWAMTGLHGFHVLVGIGLLSVMTWMASRGRFSERYYNPVEMSGLYWHFVDIVWIFLYPLFYWWTDMYERRNCFKEDLSAGLGRSDGVTGNDLGRG